MALNMILLALYGASGSKQATWLPLYLHFNKISGCDVDDDDDDDDKKVVI